MASELEQILLTPGQDLGHSEWLEITQAMITSFGEVTRDPDPLHMDPEWARANTDYEDTIAYGFLTVSLLTGLFASATGISSASEAPLPGHFLNYGFNRLRFVSPVPVNSRIRAHFRRSAEEARRDGRKAVLTVEVSIEIEGHDQPALVAEWLAAWVSHG